MIELLLQAERALWTGAFDVAERLYWQAIDADSQNAIAIVGLAKVARLKGDDRTAIAFGRRALKVDPENAVARRLVAELEAAHPEGARPTAPAEPAAPAGAATPADAAAAAPAAGAVVEPAPEPESTAPAVAAAARSVTAPEPVPATVAAEAKTLAPPAGDLPADPGVRAPKGGRPDLEWPAADLQQVRPPRDR
jgi:hypothetical protein